MSWVRRNRSRAGGVAAAGLLLMLGWGTGTVQAADEAGLWQLWSRHITAPDQHAERVAECAEFARRHEGDPMTSVARTLEAWHLLCLQRNEEARERLVPLADDSAVGVVQGARQLAQAWLTRIDREQLVAALAFYRKHEVQYPSSLSELKAYPGLPGALELPMKDQWDRPWTYRLRSLRTIPGLKNQSYTLQSPRLGATSNLEQALQVPYADGIRFRPIRLFNPSGGSPAVQFAHTEEGGNAPLVLTQGSRAEGVTLSLVTPNLIFLNDDLHWNIMRTPKATAP